MQSSSQSAPAVRLPQTAATPPPPPPPPPVVRTDTVILGAGLAGLSCATELVRGGYKGELRLLEASDAPGGRVRTDVHADGYLLDRGFQVFIESYPEARELFASLPGGFAGLDLQAFLPGAVVRCEGGFHLVSDPLRRPQDLLASLVSPVGSLVDKIIVGIFSVWIRFQRVETPEDLLLLDETSTRAYLAGALGLSPSIVDRFLQPFFQGIFLAPLSRQSSRMFSFVFKMFTTGSACLPAGGMGRVAAVLADALPVGTVAYNTRATSVRRSGDGGYRVSVEGGAYSLECRNLVVAVDPEAVNPLLMAGARAAGEDGELSKGQGGPMPSTVEVPEARGSLCLYYGMDGPPPVEQPMLILNGDNAMEPLGAQAARPLAAINNVCFPSQVSRAYAPPGKSLASVTVVDPAALKLHEVTLDACVRKQLEVWWPDNDVANWKLLRVYRIPYAQPAQTPPYTLWSPARLQDRLFLCGDHRATATLNGAIASGREAAQQILLS